jgi:hypothetical protein
MFVPRNELYMRHKLEQMRLCTVSNHLCEVQKLLDVAEFSIYQGKHLFHNSISEQLFETCSRNLDAVYVAT